MDEEDDEDFGSASDGNNSEGDDDGSLDSENGVAKVRGTNHGFIQRQDKGNSQRRQQYHAFDYEDEQSESKDVIQSQ